MNNLPEYWVVESNQSHLYKDNVIAYLNKTCGSTWSGDSYKYYGYDGSMSYGGSNCHDNLCSFKNTVTLLTLQEFMELSEEVPEKSLQNNITTQPICMIIRVPKI